MTTGWIKLHRKMQDHWIFDDPECLRAWVIILMMVQHTPGKALVKGRLLEYERGERLYSLDKWGSLFGGWGKKRVHRFFKLLEKEGMIRVKSVTVTTRLTVLNYSKFQDTGNDVVHTEETQRKRTGNADDPAGDPRVKNVKNGKNEKNVKNKYNPKSASNALHWLDDKLWSEWIDHKRRVKAAVTEYAIGLNLKQLEKFGTENANAIIGQSLGGGWKGLFALKNNNNAQAPQKQETRQEGALRRNLECISKTMEECGE